MKAFIPSLRPVARISGNWALAAVTLLSYSGVAHAQLNNRSAANPDKCMTAQAGDDGTQLILTDCRPGTPGQQFFLEADGSLRVNLRNARGNTMCVDYYPGNGGNGSPVKLWPCHGASNPKDTQHWNRAASGHYQGASGTYIDINGGNSSARNNGVPLVMWSGPGDLSQRWNLTNTANTTAPAPAPAPVPATIAAPAREPMIRTAYQDAFGRQPSDAEVKYWMGFPAGDPSMASPAALFNAQLTYLKSSVPEQQATVKRALNLVFRNELANSPPLQTYLNDNNGNAVKFASNDMLAGREGGGYRGILAWISKPENKNWYMQNAGIQSILAMPAREPMIRNAYQDAFGRQPADAEFKYWMGFPAGDPSMASPTALFNAQLTYLKSSVPAQQETVKRALDVVFKNEQAASPQLQAHLNDNNGMPVKTAIGNMLEGREGGGYKGILAWISKPEIKDWYMKNAGIQAAMGATREAMVRTAYLDAFGRQPLDAELKYWMNFPANDPSVANATALFNAQLSYLKSSVAEQRATAKAALDVVFKSEQVNIPQLRAFLDDDNKEPVKSAVRDLLSTGGGYKALLAWISKPENKSWYLKNTGIDAVIADAANPCLANASALFAFDGTETNETHRSTIWQVLNRFQGHGNCGGITRYIRGPNIAGSDSWDIFKSMFADACKDVKDKNIKKVYVIGFSRGAINAVRFANEFPTCANGMTVTFVGVSDPVDALMIGYEAGKSLIPGRAAKSFMVIKSKNEMSSNPLELVNNNFYTANVTGFTKIEQVVNNEQASSMGNADRHWMMNASSCASGRDIEARYIREMSALGISFKGQLAAGSELCKMSEIAVAKTAKNGWSQMGNQWERCFGAVGPGCDGAPGAGVTKNQDGTITAYVAVGSILHDNCCMRNGPGGVWCGNMLKGVAYDEVSLSQRLIGHCSQEWSKAVYNVRDGRMWRATFPAYKGTEGGDDLTQTGNRPAKMSVANSPVFVDYSGGETTSSRALLAPNGTVLDIDDEAFCQSGHFSERHDWVVGIGRWGRCGPR